MYTKKYKEYKKYTRTTNHVCTATPSWLNVRFYNKTVEKNTFSLNVNKVVTKIHKKLFKNNVAMSKIPIKSL
jgi:hypothetical protein